MVFIVLGDMKTGGCLDPPVFCSAIIAIVFYFFLRNGMSPIDVPFWDLPLD